MLSSLSVLLGNCARLYPSPMRMLSNGKIFEKQRENLSSANTYYKMYFSHLNQLVTNHNKYNNS